MHLISIRNLRNLTARYPDATKQVEDWYTTVKQSSWQSLADIRQIYRDTDVVGNFTVFNIKGNDYRLIVGIDYTDQTVYFKYFLTHAEYDKDKWKNDPYF
jgi:mRNA interferase HigB